MQIISQTNSHILLRFDRDEEVIHELFAYVKTEQLFGTFTAIGAAKEVVLSYYDLLQKVYCDKKISEDLEITGITGNIAILQENIIIHAHGTLADNEYRVVGGHIKSLIVSATCEVALTVLPKQITRVYDEITGLNLLQK